jgi:cysteine desulfurase family protein
VANHSFRKSKSLSRIYLDNAATSWPKPESVYRAIESMQRDNGAPAGRGSYQQASDVLRIIERTRISLARMINAEHARNIAFTFSGTDSLCTAIFGLLKPNDHVITSSAEHNSVLRPLTQLEQAQGLHLTRTGIDPTGTFNAADILAAIRPKTAMVILTHVSNVTGAIQPLEEIGHICKQHQLVFAVDAAQSLGHVPIDVQELGCDLLAAPGHKGLLGPLGTGVLYYSDEIGERMNPLRFGGTGSTSVNQDQPTEFPEKFESGNQNVAGIAGIGAGIEFLSSDAGHDRLQIAESLKQQMLRGLLQIDGLKLHGPNTAERRTGVFSISLPDLDCHEAAFILDNQWSIQTRSGLHCAPLLHQSLGTAAVGGTLRISLGLHNTPEQIRVTLDALAELAR